MSKVMRSVKNVTKGYSGAQVKVREATSNDAWGPSGTQMSEIAQMTFNPGSDFMDIMDMLDKRLNDKGKNWRHVLKALKVLDYCLHEGSEMVVTWARSNIYIIKTLREFIYVDEEGRDVGQNVRVAAKELTSLIMDENRLHAERSDRKSWKSRVHGLEDQPPPHLQHQAQQSQRQRDRGRRNSEEDLEYRLAIEASKAQEEEDRKKRESRSQDGDDDDLAKAIKLSKEEEERRRRELETTSVFDDDLIQVNAPASNSQPQYTGFNQGYQQGNPVDFFANPIDQNQGQLNGFMPAAYTGFQPQPTGYAAYANGFGDPYGQQQQTQPFQMQPTGYNPYQNQLQSPINQEPALQAGSNNPWSTNNNSLLTPPALAATPTGSNNPFASSFGRSPPAKSPMNSLGSLPEQKSLSTFSQQPQPQSFQQPSFNISPQQTQFSAQPQKELTPHEARLNSLLASGDGMDTFGNTGNLRIPAQHTAPGTFVNSAGSGVQRLGAEQTGNNPFLRTQFTGLPTVSYGAGAGMNGVASQPTNNPFAGNRPQQNNQTQDLIQF